jgi:hypothetical protein
LTIVIQRKKRTNKMTEAEFAEEFGYEEVLAVPHMWGVSFPYEGVSESCGVFGTIESVMAYIAEDKYLSGYAYPVPMVIR